MYSMELSPAFFYSTFLFSLYALLAYVVYVGLREIHKRQSVSNSLPGAKNRYLDLLGSLRYLTRSDEAQKLNPRNVYVLQLMSAYAHLFRAQELICFWIGYRPFVLFVKAKAVEELISGTKMMEKAWTYSVLHSWLGTGLLTSYGKKWKSRRKLLTPSFHFDILKEFLPIINEQSNMLVKVLENEMQKPWTDIVVPITLCSLDIICETTLGVNIGAQQNSESEYVKAVLSVSTIAMERMTNPLWFYDTVFYCTAKGQAFKKGLEVLHNFTRKVIQDKKQSLLSQHREENGVRKRMALMDLLLDHHIRNKDLSEEDIREEVDTFTFEGHDTTSMGMSWALYLIGLHEDVQAKLHEELDLVLGDDRTRPITMSDLNELKYMDCVLKESQRLYPSVPMFARQATSDINIRGYKIPKGAVCTVFTYQLHRDPEVFPYPEKFDPDRFLPENCINRNPFAYVPFSAGPRNCIGQRFAILEEKIVMASILRNFQLKSQRQRNDVQPSAELILRPSVPIQMKISPRNFSL